MNKTAKIRTDLTAEDYAEGVLSGDRAMLGRAITLIESNNPKHQDLAQEVLLKVLPKAGNARRVGITGVPGVGKSTCIEALGKNLTADGHKVAVLAVDPTSSRTGGSILGDKTRMAALSSDENAFIRPSPSSGTLGGVTRKTRETMVLCEAAGFDVILVETVGIGQSETAVSEMVDFFLVLMVPAAGDELQGIKKGVLEIADMIAVNKADGATELLAKKAATEYRAAFHILTPTSASWSPPVITISGLKNKGLDELWGQIEDHHKKLSRTGEFDDKRRHQQVRWMWAMLDEHMMMALKGNKKIAKRLPQLEKEVKEGKTTPALAVKEITELMGLS